MFFLPTDILLFVHNVNMTRRRWCEQKNTYLSKNLTVKHNIAALSLLKLGQEYNK